VENEATSATTRQYAPQQPANPYDGPYQSQLAQTWSAPDSQFDAQAQDTSRLYHAPMAQHYPNYPANYQQAAAKKSGALKWVLITLVCLLLVSFGIGVMVISAIYAHRGAERAAEAPVAPVPPAPPPPPPAIGSGLEQYKYPNAEVINSVRVLGNEALTMTTTDSVSDVREYYRKRFGDPSFEEGDSATVIFQIPGSPATLITINEDEEDSDKTQIAVVRSNIQLPKMN
jgi:hypothetical protein